MTHAHRILRLLCPCTQHKEHRSRQVRPIPLVSAQWKASSPTPQFQHCLGRALCWSDRPLSCPGHPTGIHSSLALPSPGQVRHAWFLHQPLIVSVLCRLDSHCLLASVDSGAPTFRLVPGVCHWHSHQVLSCLASVTPSPVFPRRDRHRIPWYSREHACSGQAVHSQSGVEPQASESHLTAVIGVNGR